MMWVFYFGGYMKKLIVAISITLLLFGTIGCNSGLDQSVSYKQTAYLIGECEHYDLTVISGVREHPYMMDGARGEMVEFCTITLKPRSNTPINDSCTYIVTVDGLEYKGSLNKDTFGSTLSGDIGVDVGLDMTAITIKYGEVESSIMLENMMSNAVISADDALKIATDALSDTLSNLPEDDKREVYIKFVSDVLGDESVYYWYIAFVGKGGRYSAVLIDIVSGDLIAKRA